MRQIEVGVFLPIGNNGYLMSTTSPQYMPTWELQRDLAVSAEALGYDFLFSMSKWRGFGGATRFWDFTLESISVMTALAASTQRLQLIATMSPPLLHPVVAAKMAATSAPAAPRPRSEGAELPESAPVVAAATAWMPKVVPVTSVMVT